MILILIAHIAAHFRGMTTFIITVRATVDLIRVIFLDFHFTESQFFTFLFYGRWYLGDHIKLLIWRLMFR